MPAGQKDGENQDIDESLLEGDNLLQTVTNLTLSMLNAGKELSDLSKNELKTALDALSLNYHDKIPKAELLLAMANCDDIMGLPEWCDQFQGHVSWISDSEKCWPTPFFPIK